MHIRDSIARVEAQRLAAIEKQQKEDFALSQQDSSSKTETPFSLFKQDSLTPEEFTLENNKIKLHIDSKGGRITYVDLKGYRTHDSLPLVLWQAQTSSLGLNFYIKNHQINTEELIFTPNTDQKKLVADRQEQVLSMRA